MNVLFLTGNLPYPPIDGSRIRDYSFLRTLARRHRVTVLSFIRTTDDALAVQTLRDHGISVGIIARNPRYSPAKLARGLVGSAAFPIVNYADERMAHLLARVLEEHRFDVIQAGGLHMAQYCLGLPAPTILDLHNLESLLMKRYARQVANPLKRIYAEVTWRKLDAYEREICHRFSQCVTCSDEERVLLQTKCGVERVAVIPNGVDVAGYPGPASPLHNEGSAPSAARIVFVGRMDYHANVEGVRWFCREILPAIHAVNPRVLFQIVGSHPAPAIARLAEPGKIEVTGYVADVRPYLSTAAVVVVPLRIGGGTRLKILEALAMGRAVVSTSIGVEGIEAIPDRHLLVANHPDEFARTVLALLSGPERRARLGAAGRRLVEDKYSWDGIVAELERLYETHVSVNGAARVAVQSVV